MAQKRDGAGRPQTVSDDQIFDALAQAITEHGPMGFSMNKIAARLGLTGPALGYRFGNKRGLLNAFAARQPSATQEFLADVVDNTPSPVEAIVDGLVGLVAAMTTRTEVANNLALLHLDLTDELLREHAAAQAKVIRQHITTLLADLGFGKTERELVANDIYITWNGVITSWAIDGEGTLEAAMRTQLNRSIDRAEPEAENAVRGSW